MNTTIETPKKLTNKTVNEKFTSDNYPYGRLRTTKYFEIEFNKNKGFRQVETTVNPKTGKLNKPHKSTYSMLIFLNDFEGFYKYTHFSMNCFKDINNFAQIVHDNYSLFTPEQIEYFATQMFLVSKASAKAKVIYCGSDFEKIKPLIDNQIKIIIDIIKTKENKFNLINFDIEALKATEIEGFNPFKVTHYTTL